MKTILCTLFLVLAISVAASAQSAAPTKSEPMKYAVLIGVDDYARLLKLRFAKNDIEALRDELYKIGFPKENVYCLTCGGETKDLPTKENIEVVVESVLGMAKEGDIVVIAMNGHGIEADGQARFCPIDTQESNLLTSTIPIGDIFTAFEHSKATFKLMLVDACRENPFASRSVAGASTLQTLDDPPKGVMLLQSCAKGELSYEDPNLKHGVFTHFLVEGLQGKAADKEGKVTLLGLSSYTIEKTQRRVLNEYRAKQRPYLKGEITDFVLASDPHRELRESVLADFRDYLAAESFQKYWGDHLLPRLPSWKEAAELGIPEGQVLYGYCLDNGWGVSKNEFEAAKWYRKAAERGNARAQSNLGVCYLYGEGVPKDEAEAIKWFRKADEQELAAAQYNLGVCYLHGIGVPKDAVEAVKWFRMAADQGYASAQNYLGVCYRRGNGMPKDEAEAVKWFRKAAEQEYAGAQYNLGVCYDNGNGVAKDAVEAAKWYRKAAEQGHGGAKENLKRLGEK